MLIFRVICNVFLLKLGRHSDNWNEYTHSHNIRALLITNYEKNEKV